MESKGDLIIKHAASKIRDMYIDGIVNDICLACESQIYGIPERHSLIEIKAIKKMTGRQLKKRSNSLRLDRGQEVRVIESILTYIVSIRLSIESIEKEIMCRGYN